MDIVTSLLDKLEGGWKGIAIFAILIVVVLAREVKITYTKLIDNAVASKEDAVDLTKTVVTAMEQSTEMDKAVKSALEIYQRLDTVVDYVRFSRQRGGHDD